MINKFALTLGVSLNIAAFFSAHSFELSLEWLLLLFVYGGALNGGDETIGDEPDINDVGVPASAVSLLSPAPVPGKPTPDNSTSSKPIMSSYMNSLSSKSGSWDDSM